VPGKSPFFLGERAIKVGYDFYSGKTEGNLPIIAMGII
jgi:hypothetical protein